MILTENGSRINNIDYIFGRTYPLKFRRKVLSVLEKKGLTISRVAARFDVVVRWLKDVTPKKHDRRHNKIDMITLSHDVRDHPDAYQYECAERFGVHQGAINYVLKKLGISYKNAATYQGGRRRTVYFPGENITL